MQSLYLEYLIFGAFLAIGFISTALFILYSSKSSRIRLLLVLPFVVSTVLALAAYSDYAIQYWMPLLLGLLAMTISFTLAAFCYVNRSRAFYIFMADALVVMLCIVVSFGLHAMQFMSSFAIGGLVGTLSNEMVFHFRGPRRDYGTEKDGRRVEIRRDLFQTLLGIVVISVILLVGSVSIMVVLALIIFAMLYSNLASTTSHAPFAGFFRSMERSNTTFGLGATYLAIGIALVLGLVGNAQLAMLGLIALFFGDAAATIIGVRFGKTKLPYNRRKSLEGLLAYFIVVSIMGYFVVGIYSPVVGLMFSVVESMKLRLDDNIAIALFTVVISFI